MLVYTPRKGLIVIGIILLFIRGSFSQLNYQNCTSAPCDLKCSGKTICSQSCNKRPCGMFCNSSQACQQTCVNGGCQKMKCESKTVCNLKCGPLMNPKDNCKEMSCKAPISAVMACGANCGMTCHSKCDVSCSGPGCNINCKAKGCNSRCDNGNCRVKFFPHSSGSLSCHGAGNCTYLYPVNTTGYQIFCPRNNCKKIAYTPTVYSGQNSVLHCHTFMQTLFLSVFILGLSLSTFV